MYRIFLAEDDHALAEAISRQLESWGNEVITVRDFQRVSAEFAEAHPAELACFLNEYKASVEALSAAIQGSAEKIQETGIFAKAAVAAKAIPNCNICFIDGADMQSALAAFYEVMYSLAPDSIGGSIPGDDFYCVLG